MKELQLLNVTLWNTERDRIYLDSEVDDMMQKAFDFGFTNKDIHFRGLTFEELDALVNRIQ